MKVMVTGSCGMLGQSMVRECSRRGYDVCGVDLSNADYNADLTNDTSVAELFKAIRPHVVVNCAAVVDVTLCDSNPLLAWKLNARAVGTLAELCRQYDTRLVQVSTDHYFGGDRALVHDEQAPVSFYNEYARTKFSGEAFALSWEKSLVLRTNIIGFRGHGNPTFAEWAFNAVENDLEITLFSDSYVSSIDTESFCSALWDLTEKNLNGLVNLASRDVFSKKDLIEKISEISGNPLSKSRSGSVQKLGVSRADSCGLDVRKAEQMLGYSLPALNDVVGNLVSKRNANL